MKSFLIQLAVALLPLVGLIGAIILKETLSGRGGEHGRKALRSASLTGHPWS